MKKTICALAFSVVCAFGLESEIELEEMGAEVIIDGMMLGVCLKGTEAMVVTFGASFLDGTERIA